jgi:polyhydroxybutyrate depolymerase
MRHLILGLIIILSASCKRSLYESDYHTMKHDGEKRSYLLHVPPSYSDATETPLMIALHGGVGSAKNIEEQSGLAEFSDEKGFILCSPNGINRTWNAGWCCGKAQEKEIDDVGFISKLIDQLKTEYNIDANRVYITGMSNGAMMSYRLACELSTEIAAIATVAGGMVMDQCEPSSSVSIIHFHSYEDSNIPHLGGVGDGISDHYNAPLDSIREFWSQQLECPIYTEIDLSTEVDIKMASGCLDSNEVVYYYTTDGGHSWPGGRAPTRNGDAPSEALNANEVMWEFFMKHPKR